MTHSSVPADRSVGGISSAHAQEDVVETVHRVMGADVVAAAESDHPDVRATGGAPDDGSSTTEVGKEQAAQVVDTMKQTGAQVAGTVQEQVGAVTSEAGLQARQLFAQAQSELSSQAGATQQRASEGLHALADELHGMVKGSEQDGPVTDLARQAADRAHQAAGWLADRDPGALLDEVRSFGRRRPAAFLAMAVGAGVLAGRLNRGLTATSGAGSTSPAAVADPAAPRPSVTAAGPGGHLAGHGGLTP